MTTKHAAMIDLDGTLLDIAPLFDVLVTKNDLPKYYELAVQHCPAHQEMIDHCQELVASGVNIFVTTSRSETAREHTEQWVRRNCCFPVKGIIMCPEVDRKKPDTGLKLGVRKQIKRLGYTVTFGADDKIEILEAYRAVGLKILVPQKLIGVHGEYPVAKETYYRDYKNPVRL